MAVTKHAYLSWRRDQGANQGANLILLVCCHHAILKNYCTSQWPYHVECTRSRLITEVKQHWAQLVLELETAWEFWALFEKKVMHHIHDAQSSLLAHGAQIE